ncbi:uncharacterized protein [Rutidosis leptorrhynchoides]|uniref:uncharacterized protein isoform X2 n=1 Tax=Rutidosis leptorrhynchoides TaxID=125765 RepID=UPI003A9965FA
MDRYTKVEQKKPNVPINQNEIRITSQGLVRNYIIYATTLLQDKRGNEIVLKAMGQVISKTVAIAEIIKRNIPRLHQDTEISSISITDVWEPIEEGLLPVEMTRQVSMISITLSTKELDKNSPGYQAPLYVDRPRPQYNNYQRQQSRQAYNAVNEEDGNYHGNRGRGQGGVRGERGRGLSRGGYGNQGDGYRNFEGDGYRNYQGDGPRNYQRDGPRNFQRDGPRNYQGDGPRNYQRDGSRDYQGDGPRNYQRDGPRNYQGDGPRNFQRDGPRNYHGDGGYDNYRGGRGGGYGNYRGGRGYGNNQGGGDYGNYKGSGEYGNYQDNNGYANRGRGGRGGNAGYRDFGSNVYCGC